MPKNHKILPINKQNESQLSENFDESSYYLKPPSVQDSQIDHFIPYASPSILTWYKNKRTNSLYANASDVERKRGDSDQDSTAASLILIPADNTFDVSNFQSEHLNDDNEKANSNENAISNSRNNSDRLSIQTQHSKWDDYNNKSNISLIYSNKNDWINNSDHSSKSLLDFSSKIHKKLDFLDSTMNNKVDDKESFNASSSFASNTSIGSTHVSSINTTVSTSSLKTSKNTSKLNSSNNFIISSKHQIVETTASPCKLPDEQAILPNNDAVTHQNILETVNLNKDIQENQASSKKKTPSNKSHSSSSHSRKYENLKTTDMAIKWEISMTQTFNDNTAHLKVGKSSSKLEKTHCDSHSITSISDVSQTSSSIHHNQTKDSSDISDLVSKFYINIKQNELINQETRAKLAKFELHNSKPTTIESKSEKNKENYLSEASTQTSFAVPSVPPLSTNSNNGFKILTDTSNSLVNANANNGNKERAKEEKIKKLMELEKQQREKKIREIKKLAHFEKICAQNIKKLMLCSEDDSLSSLNLSDPFSHSLTINETHFDNQTFDVNFYHHQNVNGKKDLLAQSKTNSKQIDATQQRRKSEMMRTDFDKYKLKNFEDISIIPDDLAEPDDQREAKRLSSNKLLGSKVEILQLKDTTVINQPEGVLVVKEKENNSKVNDNKNKLATERLQQTNQIHDLLADEDGRLFFTYDNFTIGGGKTNNGRNSKINTKPLVHSQKLVKKAFIQANQLSQKTEDTMSKFKSNEDLMTRTELIAKNHPAKIPQSHLANQAVDLQFNNKNLNALKKMSLQEAFEAFNPNLIARSQRRLKAIEMRAEKRREEAQQQEQKAILRVKNFKNFRFKSNEPITYKRQLTSQEIKQITRKNYEKLPEFQAKQVKSRIEMEKRLNRFKSSIFNRTIQQHVLSKGPNFGMNFKAFQDI